MLRSATMCGRYSLASNEFSQLKVDWQWPEDLPFEPRYNIAPSAGPGHESWVLLTHQGVVTPRKGRFWFIPASWRKPLSALPTSFNARAEEVTQKPFFRDALRERRCLIPATGWREFSGPAGRRQPFHFHFGHRPFVFAGIWDQWFDGQGQGVLSFAILTVAARGRAAAIHNRMPLRLSTELSTAWLDPTLTADPVLDSALRAELPEPDVYPSDPAGNAVSCEGPTAIAPTPEPQQLGLFR